MMFRRIVYYLIRAVDTAILIFIILFIYNIEKRDLSAPAGVVIVIFRRHYHVSAVVYNAIFAILSDNRIVGISCVLFVVRVDLTSVKRNDIIGVYSWLYEPAISLFLF